METQNASDFGKLRSESIDVGDTELDDPKNSNVPTQSGDVTMLEHSELSQSKMATQRENEVEHSNFKNVEETLSSHSNVVAGPKNDEHEMIEEECRPVPVIGPPPFDEPLLKRSRKRRRSNKKKSTSNADQNAVFQDDIDTEAPRKKQKTARKKVIKKAVGVLSPGKRRRSARIAAKEAQNDVLESSPPLTATDLMAQFAFKTLRFTVDDSAEEIRSALRARRSLNLKSMLTVYNKWRQSEDANADTLELNSMSSSELVHFANCSICRFSGKMNPDVECQKCKRWIIAKRDPLKKAVPYQMDWICPDCS